LNRINRNRQPQRKISLATLSLLIVATLGSTRARAEILHPDRVSLDPRSAKRYLIEQTSPEYPVVAKLNYIRGKVTLRILVGRKGVVKEATVLDGHPLLAAAALRTVWQWRYRPYVAEGRPLEFSSIVNMNFSLRTDKPELGEKQASKDFDRQVQPPNLCEPTSPANGRSTVRVRMLVDEHGHVLDVTAPKGFEFMTLREKWIDWKFRPAQWGSIPIPWYVELEVPAQELPDL